MITNRQALRYSIATATLILILSTIVLAHGDQQHVMGTVTKIDSGSITVKTTTGEVKTVMVLPTTKYCTRRKGRRPRGHSRKTGRRNAARNRSQNR
jgi:hypothetical protein